MSAAAFRAAVESGDPDAAADLFAPDAVFHSPVVHAPYAGREALRRILRAVTVVFEDFRYTAEYAGEHGHVLEFACRVGDRDLQGVDILRGDILRGDGLRGDGLLTELTVLVRPYSAATALRTRMAELLTGGTAPG
ncbi:MAG TPA: nuclear transport factor 2 family protein [Pseudonocardia sp.]|nr:nuclear transport factor 2 family protein [Pseudonocardia sp.]